jgi:hypothetical protein
MLSLAFEAAEVVALRAGRERKLRLEVLDIVGVVSERGRASLTQI